MQNYFKVPLLVCRYSNVNSSSRQSAGGSVLGGALRSGSNTRGRKSNPSRSGRPENRLQIVKPLEGNFTQV